jgi:hypothetical protein
MFDDLRFRLRRFFRPHETEAELEEELRFNPENEREKGMKAGLRADEADRMVRLQFGGIGQVKDECRDAWGTAALETTLQDLRYAVRVLRKTPVFTAVALLLLAIGVGVNTSLFTIANQVLLKVLAVRDPTALTQLELEDPANHVIDTEMSYPAFEIFSRPNPLISGMFAVSEQLQVNPLSRGVPGLASAVFESAEAPSVLGLHPAFGRLFNVSDDKPSSEAPPAVLSYRYWQKRFGGNTKHYWQVCFCQCDAFCDCRDNSRWFSRLNAGNRP